MIEPLHPPKLPESEFLGGSWLYQNVCGANNLGGSSHVPSTARGRGEQALTGSPFPAFFFLNLLHRHFAEFKTNHLYQP